MAPSRTTTPPLLEGVEATTTATSGIETNGNNTNDTVVLKNSTLNVPNGFGIYFPSSGTLTIDNSTINAKTMGAQVCSGNLNVNAGSTITVSGDPVEKAEGDGAIQDGAAISIVNRAGYKGLGQIAIAGGTFKAKGNNAALKAYTWDSATKQELAFDNSAKTVAVYGGTFSSAVPEALCAEGCNPVENPDGTHGVSGSVAQVGFKAFNTLQAAIDAAQDGETVTLLTDAAEDATIAAGKNITLNLGGKTLTNTNTGKATLTIAKGATATVKNGSIVGGTGYYTIDNYGTATLEDVTATAGNTDSSMIRNDGTLTIEGGSYSGGLNVVKSEEDSTLNINGGKFELSHAVKYGYTAVILVYGNTTITDGEFVCSATTPNWANPKVVMTGEVAGHPSFTKITGGSFVNKYSGGGIFHGYTPATSDNFEVSGGTFNKSISEGYCADGFIPTKNADGTYGVKEGYYVAQVGSKKYETLADAIRLAAKGKTITLLTDVEQNTQLTINKNITLDLNGKTIKNTQDILGDNANAILSITNGAKVTITGNGTIDAKENDCYTINVVKGDLTIENGTFYGNVSVVQVQEGTLSVKGGTFDLHQKWEGSSKYLFNCIDDAYAKGSANVAISGGTFVGFDPSASPEGEGSSYLAPGYAPTDNGDGTYGVVAGVAQIGSKAYASLQAAIDAAQTGDTVQLIADAVVDATVVVQNKGAITLDLSDKTISNTKEIWNDDSYNWSLVSVRGNSDLTITGNGAIDALANDSYAIDLQDAASKCTIENGAFTGNISAVYVFDGSLTINGGTFDIKQMSSQGDRRFTINCYDSNYKNGTAQVSIKGGTFNGFDPANNLAEGMGTAFTAPGYTSVANADGTYGVKLAEGAYLLQDYRTGDQVSWTYPAKEGKAFAGWYKDAAFTAPCTANDVEGAAYAKFVNITDLLKYKGRSLRMDKGDPSETTYLRFGYTKAIPNGATYIENGWYYKRLSAPTGDDIRFAAYNNALNDDGTITSNLVFNNVKARLYTANFIEKAFVKYVTIDGTTVEAVEGAYHSSSVSEAADAIIAHPMASKAEKDYATSIKSAIQ